LFLAPVAQAHGYRKSALPLVTWCNKHGSKCLIFYMGSTQIIKFAIAILVQELVSCKKTGLHPYRFKIISHTKGNKLSVSLDDQQPMSHKIYFIGAKSHPDYCTFRLTSVYEKVAKNISRNSKGKQRVCLICLVQSRMLANAFNSNEFYLA
jgi:hypothetical protein